MSRYISRAKQVNMVNMDDNVEKCESEEQNISKHIKRNEVTGKKHKLVKKENKSKRFKTLGISESLEEDRLEQLVFGQGTKLLDALHEVPSEAEAVNSSSIDNKDAPAWQDSDPGEFISNRAQKFNNIVGNPKWAELDRKRSNLSDDEDDEDDPAILRHCGNLLSSGKNASLTRGTIEIKRSADLNRSTYTEGPVIKAVEFHPTSTVALVAGVSGIATLFQVDGRLNAKLQSIQFNRFPISCARFATNGTEFLVGSQHHKHFHCYDMEAGQSVKVNPGLDITNFKNFELSPDGRLMAVIGRFGDIHLLTARTKEVIDTLKMNSEATAISFNSSGSRLYSHGDTGEMYVWDMQSRSCVERLSDDGCVGGTSLALSQQYLAAGSNSGAVNIYSVAKSAKPASGSRLPLKTLLHLRTPVSALRFNAAEELLAVASDCAKDAVKLVHLPSFTVYANFPGPVESLWRPQCVAFSPNGGFMAVGNNKATALLFRLKHYGNY